MASNTNENVRLVEHPVISRDLTLLRDETTSVAQFRQAVERASLVLVYHALKELSLNSFDIETPVQKATGYEIEQDIIAVPILRAGLGMVNAVLTFAPDAAVGHLGMYRDEETLKPVDYYSNIPNHISEAMTLVVDPMLATGGSAHDALTHLKDEGAQHMRFVSLISAPEGIELLQNKHPDVPIITAAVDEKLDENAFIVPGLGDAGDRYFGTE